ncbi:hypothetical protein [Tortoise microvirus 43]|nr:hypothetical protein [Tortoise microvirus 43]
MPKPSGILERLRQMGDNLAAGRPFLTVEQQRARQVPAEPEAVVLPLESPLPPLEARPESFQMAMVAMRDQVFLRSRKYKEQQAVAVRSGAHPAIVQFERLLVRELAKHGLPFYAHCVVRDKAEQQRLYIMGHTRDSPVDGKWPHRAFAVDIVHSVRHWNLTRTEWDCVGHIGKELAARRGLHMKWGGDFKGFWDPAHWELRDWKYMELPE